MTYTINGKEWTEFDINNAIRDILISKLDMDREYNQFVAKAMRLQPINYTHNPADTDSIIDKCFDDLMVVHMTDDYRAYWEVLMQEHKCTKLVAACICFIEINA